MKRILLTLLIATVPLAVPAQQSRVAAVKQEAAACAKALMAGDYEALVRYTHARVVALLGGKEKMIAAVKEGTARMRAGGSEFAVATVGQPEEPRKTGPWLTALVPEHVEMKLPGGRVLQDSHLLGISEDEGKTWVFVDLGPITGEEFAKVFPELAGKLSLPEKRKPEFRKDGPP